jgi:hypothetical protein
LNNQKGLLRAIHLPAAVPHVRDSLYRWIDAVASHGKLVLMERELIEPELFCRNNAAMHLRREQVSGHFLLTINRR